MEFLVLVFWGILISTVIVLVYTPNNNTEWYPIPRYWPKSLFWEIYAFNKKNSAPGSTGLRCLENMACNTLYTPCSVFCGERLPWFPCPPAAVIARDLRRQLTQTLLEPYWAVNQHATWRQLRSDKGCETKEKLMGKKKPNRKEENIILGLAFGNFREILGPLWTPENWTTFSPLKFPELGLFTA